MRVVGAFAEYGKKEIRDRVLEPRVVRVIHDNVVPYHTCGTRNEDARPTPGDGEVIIEAPVCHQPILEFSDGRNLHHCLDVESQILPFFI